MRGLDFSDFWEEVGPDLPEWAHDHQARSRRTRESVLSTARNLLESDSWESVSMPDLAREADLSIGALYARFPSKDAVLQLLAAAIFHEASRAFARAFAENCRSLSDIAERYTATLVDQLSLHRRVIQEARTSSAALPELRSLMDRVNHTIHQGFLDAVDRTPEGSQLDEELVRTVLFTVNATAREAIISGALRTYELDLTAAKLKAWLDRVLLAGFREDGA